VRPRRPQFLRALRALCDEHGLLLIFDEVQTGIGRTGKLFAYEWARRRRPTSCSAKGIGGGFPLGACLATAEAGKGMTAGTHGSTFGGNPLAMAVGQRGARRGAGAGFLERVQRKALLSQAAARRDQGPPPRGDRRACAARACCSACKLLRCPTAT
jgi:acetylornithine/N-succinyldiaminopimelate aminotransferase